MVLYNKKLPVFRAICALHVVFFASYLCGATLDENGERPSDNKTLGAFLNTKYTWKSSESPGHNYMNRHLRKNIASFTRPTSSHEVPIDFITHATIIPEGDGPEDWGYVLDIARDVHGKIKVLACKVSPINPPSS